MADYLRAAPDIAQLHTQLLQLPPALQPEATQGRQVGLAHPPLPEPSVPPTEPTRTGPDPRTLEIATHLREAIRLRKEAETLLGNLQVISAQASDASERWLSLVHLIGRTSDQNTAYKQLETRILDYSHRLANLRQRWSTTMVQAREHEEIARAMQEGALR